MYVWYVCMYMYICMYVFMYICTYVCIYIYVCVYIYICIYMYAIYIVYIWATLHISCTARLFTALLLYSLMVQLYRHGLSCHSVTSWSSYSSLHAFWDSDILHINIIIYERDGHHMTDDRDLIGWCSSRVVLTRPQTPHTCQTLVASCLWCTHTACTDRTGPSHQFNIRIVQDGPEDGRKTVLQPRTLPDGKVLSRLLASRPAVCDGLNLKRKAWWE